MDVTFRFNFVNYTGTDSAANNFVREFTGLNRRVNVETSSNLRTEIAKLIPESLRDRISFLEIILNGCEYNCEKSLEDQNVRRGCIVGIGLGIDVPASYKHVCTSGGGHRKHC